jgi:soluble lytic murein transglycosylase-like protein
MTLLRTIAAAVLTACSCLPAGAQAASQMPPQPLGNDVSACWRGAAQYHGVDVWLLYSVAWVESKLQPGQIGRNTNGTFDLGLMQINTIWLPKLKKFGISSNQLMDGCTSIYVGAWIMAQNIRSMGYTWRAIGAYNSRTPSIGFKYAQKVYAAHSKITGVPTTYYGPALLARK